MAGLREVLQESDEEEDDLDDSSSSNAMTPAKTGRLTNSSAVLFGTEFPTQDFHSLERPAPDMASWLLAVYRERFDPICKIVHWPTVYTTFSLQHHQGRLPELSVADQALESAIHFTALCTLQDIEVNGRSTLVEQYRARAEASLVRAGLLSSQSVVVLQAFVIYLVSASPFCDGPALTVSKRPSFPQLTAWII